MIKTGWENLSVLKKITVLILIITALVIGYSLFIYAGFFMIKINGTMYNDITAGKDLIADILPPPEYIVEPYQISLELLEEHDPVEIQKSISTLRNLQSEYITRHEYWTHILDTGQIREKMMYESYIPAMMFWDDIESRFIPAIQAGDYDSAKKIVYGSMKNHYRKHRAVIDEIVILVKKVSYRFLINIKN